MNHQGMRRWAAVCSAAAVLLPSAAWAAGWDTPIIYTARHQGMGGTAIGYVDDPSAAFHNPAGLQGVEGLELFGNFTLLLAHIDSSPNRNALSIESETIVAPFPMLAAGYRAHDWISLGAAIFPVASGSASYEYEVPRGANTAQVEDELRAVFVEATPLLSINVPEDEYVPGKLSFGAGYRITAVDFTRDQSSPGSTILDLETFGINWTGYRVGAEYWPIPELKFGVVYRSKVTVDTDADDGVANAIPVENVELDFILPAKLGFGARADMDRFGVAVDYELAFQSQNDTVTLSGDVGDSRINVPNPFQWEDGSTVRVGFEYRLGIDYIDYVPLRAGYIFDGQVTNPRYPSAFGTPPIATHSITIGTGYWTPSWELNAGAAYRFSGTKTIDDDEIDHAGCLLCSYGGDYKLSALAFQLDGSVNFDL